MPVDMTGNENMITHKHTGIGQYEEAYKLKKAFRYTNIMRFLKAVSTYSRNVIY